MTAALGHVVLGPEDAPALLLGSSLGTTHEMWAPQLDALTSSFRVVAFDHRGHGASQVPPGPYSVDDLGADVVALLDRLAVGRFAYAGLSLGGMVGMWLAAEMPERVDALALLCTSAYLGPASGYRERAGVVRRDGTAAVADAVVARWFTARFRDESPGVVARHRAMLEGVPREGYAGCCEAIADLDLRTRLAQVRAPTLVIAGGGDEATPTEHAEQIRSAVAGARLVVLPDAAHLANVEQPAIVSRLLAEHLGGG